MRFARRAEPIALLAMLIDPVSFGSELPGLPSPIVGTGLATLAEAHRTGGYMLAVHAITHVPAGPVIGRLSDRRKVPVAGLLCFGGTDALWHLRRHRAPAVPRPRDHRNRGRDLRPGQRRDRRRQAARSARSSVRSAQALTFGAERGMPGGAFLLAAIRSAATFAIFLFGVVLRRGKLARSRCESRNVRQG